MKFLELNKKRHATKHFTDKPVDPKDVRTAIEIATLAPSAHNSQPWKFVVVREKNAELAKLAYGSNFEQVSAAPVTIALFTDTDLAKRARKIARVGGANNFSEEQLQYFMKNLPAEFARYSEQQVSQEGFFAFFNFCCKINNCHFFFLSLLDNFIYWQAVAWFQFLICVSNCDQEFWTESVFNVQNFVGF